jgi:hypothetical protein
MPASAPLAVWVRLKMLRAAGSIEVEDDGIDWM